MILRWIFVPVAAFDGWASAIAIGALTAWMTVLVGAALAALLLVDVPFHPERIAAVLAGLVATAAAPRVRIPAWWYR